MAPFSLGPWEVLILVLTLGLPPVLLAAVVLLALWIWRRVRADR